MEIIETFKNNEINKKMLKLFKSKRILIIENDHTLSGSVGNFWLWCVENKLEHNTIFNLSELPIDYIMNQIEWFDIIVFETQWVYEISKLLKEEISKLKRKKIIVECYVSESSWNYKPNVIHDIYTLNTYGDDMDNWEFDKLRIRK